MATPTRRRRPTARTRRPTAGTRRTGRRPAGRRRQNSLGGAALATALVVGLLSTHPALVVTLAVLASAGGVAWYLHRTGRLRLPARPAAAGPGGFAHSLAAYQGMTYTQFEHAVADLARRDPAVHDTVVSGGKNDRGLDVLVRFRDGRRYLIQCKRWKGRVGSEEIMKINGTYAAIHSCFGAAIVTTSDFTQDAQRTNAMFDRPLRLVDGRSLARWAAGGRPPWSHG